jgi:hypothetical protein
MIRKPELLIHRSRTNETTIGAIPLYRIDRSRTDQRSVELPKIPAGTHHIHVFRILKDSGGRDRIRNDRHLSVQLLDLVRDKPGGRTRIEHDTTIGNDQRRAERGEPLLHPRQHDLPKALRRCDIPLMTAIRAPMSFPDADIHLNDLVEIPPDRLFRDIVLVTQILDHDEPIVWNLLNDACYTFFGFHITQEYSMDLLPNKLKFQVSILLMLIKQQH